MKDCDLDPTLSRKESINENDLHYFLMYLWIQDTHVYFVERQRVQQSLMTLLIALTTMRPDVFVENGCYKRTNETLFYRDVILRFVKNLEDFNQTMLLMEMTVTFWKSERESKKPWVTLFRWLKDMRWSAP